MAIAKPGARYSFKCQTCGVAKQFGAARLMAEIEASKHSRRFSWHSVEILETFVLHTFKATDGADELPLDTPPF